MTTESTDRIVVGVDGSQPSKHALQWAAFIAAATGTSIEAIAVWRMPATAAGPGWADVPVEWDKTKDTGTQLHAALVEAFGQHFPPKLTAVVREGNAAKVLIDASAGARMLIVGSRGHGGFIGLLLGSVSHTCTAHASCPVLVVRGESPPAPPAS